MRSTSEPPKAAAAAGTFRARLQQREDASPAVQQARILAGVFPLGAYSPRSSAAASPRTTAERSSARSLSLAAPSGRKGGASPRIGTDQTRVVCHSALQFSGPIEILHAKENGRGLMAALSSHR
jgi:hypothetical protein